MRDLPPGIEGRIEIFRYLDSDGDRNRGWRDDVLAVRVDDVAAGHLRISFIPAERAAKWYPNGAWDWLRLISGLTTLPEDPQDPKAEECLNRYSGRRLGKVDLRRNPQKEFMRRVNVKHGEEWGGFKAWHVERPVADILTVYDEHETRSRDWTGPLGEFAPRHPVDFKGLGIAHLMLREGARWMAESGRRLHASTDRRPDAVALWDRLETELADAVSVEDRAEILSRMPPGAPVNRIIDGSKVPLWLPDWATSVTLVREDGARVDLASAPRPR